MIRSRIFRRVALMAALVMASTAAGAELTVYTDRAAWEAAVPTGIEIEDFESDPLGDYETPYTTAGGFRLTSLLDPITIQITDQTSINGTHALHYRDFGNQLCWDLPELSANAFGFDYDTDMNDWELRVGDATLTLPAGTTGFVGVVDDARTYPRFVTTCDAYVQGGLSVDNVSVAGVFFGDYRVTADPSVWWSLISDPIVHEDFESDPLGTYTTPYTTGNDLYLTGVHGPITIQITDQTSINTSHALHYRDFGDQLFWEMPYFGCQGFCFDYDTDFNDWELIYEDYTVVLPRETTGFVGFITPSAAYHMFITTCDAYAQGGLSVDELWFAPEPSAARETTWGSVKALY